MLIKGQDVANIKPGNTLASDGHAHKVFDYMLSNLPFGVEWKQSEKVVRKEYEEQGFNGRFGPGLPRISDGSLLFMLHLVKKMRTLADGGCTLAAWRDEYNCERPHSSLDYRTPREFRQQLGYADVESKERFPHPHSLGGGETISTPKTKLENFSYQMDEKKGVGHAALWNVCR